jgi:transcriptional repressor NrdR
MRCIRCQATESKVNESRFTAGGDSIRRRRECLNCHLRYTTYERIEKPNLAVVKKNGNRELFDRHKLSVALRLSVGKFFSSEVELEEVVNRVEEALYAKNINEIRSQDIGDLLLKELAETNKVAYVRFASVYKEFRSLEEFERILKQVKNM